ncbi:MAG: hypothetical protein QOG77_3510 [Solirubrobacteraceae bacterium]|jgi:hypothetical protein|nr:hypothetical protein [Solirubrobacteraceae bacterium]
MSVTAADPIPTERARELVRGGFDTHVHIDPDVIARRVDDVTLTGVFAERGLAGFLMKSHYVSTAERAKVVNAVAPDGVRALGAIALNNAIGGLNPLAVEIAGREGARTVWLPTVDAANETAGRVDPKPGAKLPAWAQMQQDLRARGMDRPPVAVVDEAGKVVHDLQLVLEVIADHGMQLATGHLSRDEIFAVVDAAVERGVRDIVITHPDFPSQSIGIEDQVELARKGAMLERCFVTFHTEKAPWERMFEGIRATGAENNVLSTDLGQKKNPPVEDGLPLMADRMLEAGFSEDEVRMVAVTNTRRMAGVEVSS